MLEPSDLVLIEQEAARLQPLLAELTPFLRRLPSLNSKDHASDESVPAAPLPIPEQDSEYTRPAAPVPEIVEQMAPASLAGIAEADSAEELVAQEESALSQPSQSLEEPIVQEESAEPVMAAFDEPDEIESRLAESSAPVEEPLVGADDVPSAEEEPSYSDVDLGAASPPTDDEGPRTSVETIVPYVPQEPAESPLSAALVSQNVFDSWLADQQKDQGISRTEAPQEEVAATAPVVADDRESVEAPSSFVDGLQEGRATDEPAAAELTALHDQIEAPAEEVEPVPQIMDQEEAPASKLADVPETFESQEVGDLDDSTEAAVAADEESRVDVQEPVLSIVDANDGQMPEELPLGPEDDMLAVVSPFSQSVGEFFRSIKWPED